LQKIGAVEVRHQYKDNRQVASLYLLRDDRPAELEGLVYADKRDANGDKAYVGRCATSERVGASPVTHRTRSYELEPIKEKEKSIKREKENMPDHDALTEFVNQVRAIYPEGCNNPGWASFTKKARTSLKTKTLKDKYLLAVRGYASTSPNFGYVKQPSSLMNLMDDYCEIALEAENEYRSVEARDDWGDL
jgi:hypothetical protein